MSLITIIWSMNASACLTLAAINVLVWCQNRKARANLLFSLLAIGTAAWAFCELWMMRARTPAEFAAVLKWGHVAVWLVVVSLVGFARVYLRAGQPWLAWMVCGLRTLLLIVNFLVGQNLNYLEITRLGHMSLLGESVTIVEGVPNPWILLGQLNLMILIIFLVDATVTTWRRGDRHRALTVGGSIVFFTLVSTGQSLLAFYGIVRAPYVATISIMGLIAVMGYELSSETIHASTLGRKLHKSEAGLHESEERMRLAVEAAGFGIWIRDLARTEIWATDRWRALFGFSETERLELENVLQRLHSADRDAVRLLFEEAIEGDGSYETEFRVLLPSGDVRWIGSRGRGEFDGTGKPILVRGVSHDITGRKAAEQETQKLRQEIAHVGRVSMMGQLSSALAHEINQPLGAILRNAEAAELLMQEKSPDLDEIRVILADIRKDDQRAGNVIDRMRTLLKRHDLDKRPVDVGELVGEVAALVRSDAAARNIKLELAVADNLPLVYGDPVHLQQVLLNLIVNGMDAVGGTSVNDRRIRMTAKVGAAGAVEIAVSDSGNGIAVEKLAQVFESFFTTKPNGMGMGLPISRTIIEAHGGRLWAENNNGGGATFRFTLPVAEGGAARST
jgi:two-component system, LuxR family, sensor kinase FixL